MTEALRVPDPTRSGRVTPEVSASTQSVVVAPPQTNPEVEGFLKGMAQFTQQSGALFEERQGEVKKSGRNAAKSGAALTGTEPKTFVEGFQYGQGEAAAIADGEELAAKINSEFNSNTGNIEKFVQDFYMSKTQALDPKSKVAEGYNAVFSQAAQEFRRAITEKRAQEIVTTNEANAQARIDYIVDTAVRLGQPLSEAHLHHINAVASEQRIAGPRKDYMTFLALKKYSDQGMPEIWDVARLPRKDAVTGQDFPSIYANPKFKKDIDEAVVHATRTRLSNADAQDVRLRKAREEAREEAIAPAVRAALAGNEVEARRILDNVLTNTALFNRAEDIAKYADLVRKEVNETQRPNEKALAVNYMVDVRAGKLNVDKILALTDIGHNTKNELVRFYYSEVDRQRREAREQRVAESTIRANDRAYFSDPMLKQDLDYLDNATRLGPSMSDPMGFGSTQDNIDRARMKDVFMQEVARNRNMTSGQRMELRNKLLADFHKARASQVIKTDPAMRLGPPGFSTPQGRLDYVTKYGLEAYNEALRMHELSPPNPVPQGPPKQR